ncbi:Arsenite oxidase subunit AioB [Stutzerimonas xanthomarina]|uniref:Arsenite oxidase subunit A n=1 Tax=Pseudomonas sp. S11 TaxID=578315 RepID=E5AZM2_9PSED|nr:arsenite oxidase subunit A [Pseudomonas sp. S11]CEG54807.1 Arsenite oxidase subunit AioB [Stutzerimonas xanthomarina]
MGKLTRRIFLKYTGSGAAVGTLALSSSAFAQEPTQSSPPGATTLPYPQQAVAKLGDLEINNPVSFSYPDGSSPCALIKKGKPVSGGVGPDKDIVAYSTLCTHMGCPVLYDKSAETFKCPCHYSIFDPDQSGQMVIGQATENLPQIMLNYNEEEESVYAIAVQGLIYGRQANII